MLKTISRASMNTLAGALNCTAPANLGDLAASTVTNRSKSSVVLTVAREERGGDSSDSSDSEMDAVLMRKYGIKE
jgi:hypothetical protein